jgi:glucokinase
MKSIGIDIGGTKIKAGLVSGDHLISSTTVKTPQQGSLEEVITAIKSAVSEVMQPSVEGIGAGVPGLVDTRQGMVHDVMNIPSFKKVPLKSILEAEFSLPAEVNNDANCFALGAKNFGVGKNFENLVGLTLGTGLGGGIVINGQLYEGTGCGAGEFGYLPYRDGILEHYCSGQFFKRQYDISGEKAYENALKGDEFALQMFHRFGYHLGEAVKMIAHVFAPQAIILGGSVSETFPLFKNSMWSSIHLFPYKHVVDNLLVEPVSNPDIAVIGAASLVTSKNRVTAD